MLLKTLFLFRHKKLFLFKEHTLFFFQKQVLPVTQTIHSSCSKNNTCFAQTQDIVLVQEQYTLLVQINTVRLTPLQNLHESMLCPTKLTQKYFLV